MLTEPRYPDGCCIYFTFSGIGSDDSDAIQKYERAWRDALAPRSDLRDPQPSPRLGRTRRRARH